VAEAEAEADGEVEADAEMEANAEAEAEAMEAEAEAIEADTEPEVQAGAAADAGAEVDAEIDAEMEVEADAHAQAGAVAAATAAGGSAMTPQQAHTASAAEGLTLVRSSKNATGFFNVRRNGRLFEARVSSKDSLGYFETAEEAALRYARHLGPEASAEKAGPPAALPAPVMTSRDVRRAADAEGLTLVRANNVSGFLNVRRNGRLFEARVRERGVQKTLGWFESADEAALAYARHDALSSQSNVRQKA